LGLIRREEHALVEKEVDRMAEEDLEEHRVVEESIEEEEVHRAMEDLFESLPRTRCVPGSGPRTKV
jgi:hypothetical protein